MSTPGESGPTFVLCIEDNAIRNQALLLCKSIRRFGGRHRDAPILAIAPRPGLGVDAATRAELESLCVEYVEEPLNLVCSAYGSANRVFAAAWTEEHVRSEWIVVLDSDTIFLEELVLPEDADVAVRPVDMKGSTTAGPGDPFEDYWNRLAELQGRPLDALPFIRTTDLADTVRASYNGGLVVVRRESGILRAWAELFERSVVAGLKPRRGIKEDVFASTGYVGLEASEYWGSNQTALALAIWSKTSRVTVQRNNHNVPLHLLLRRPDLHAGMEGAPLVHLHYHWLFTKPYYHSAITLMEKLGAEADDLEWLTAELPIA